MKEEIIYLNRILKIIDDLESYVGQDEFEDFLLNDMKIDAIMMKLQLLGETIKKIGKYKEIPYKEIIGLRDWISHNYFGIDLEIIWETLNEELPILRGKIILIIESKK